MTELNLPPLQPKLRRSAEGMEILDLARKKYVALTPEEWVRQHIISWLHNSFGYPMGLAAVEQVVRINGMNKRADIIWYSNNQSPILLVECKAPEVKIDQKTVDQALRYNQVVGAPFVLVSNGLNHYCCQVNHKEERLDFVETIPTYQSS